MVVNQSGGTITANQDVNLAGVVTNAGTVSAVRGVKFDLVPTVGRHCGLVCAASRRHAITGGKVHANDTPLLILAPGNSHKKTGCPWVYVRDDRPSAGEAISGNN